MVKKHNRKSKPSPPRHNKVFDFEWYHSIYSDDFFNEISNDLGIQKESAKEELKKTICCAAGYYDSSKRCGRNYEPPEVEKKVLRGFSQSLSKSKLFYQKMRDTSMAHNRFHTNIGESFNTLDTHPKVRDMILSFVDGGTIYPQALEDFLAVIERAAILAEDSVDEKRAKLVGQTKIDSLVIWLMNLDVFWMENSEVPFSAGRYNIKDGTQKSTAIDILERIIKPLDAAITRSNIVTAMDRYRERRKSS